MISDWTLKTYQSDTDLQPTLKCRDAIASNNQSFKQINIYFHFHRAGSGLDITVAVCVAHDVVTGDAVLGAAVRVRLQGAEGAAGLQTRVYIVLHTVLFGAAKIC